MWAPGGTNVVSDPFIPQVGAVFSADIAVPEHERELRFYSRVLSTGDHPLWREQDLMNNLGMPIIGLGARSAEHANLPLQWMPHIQVASVATSVQRAVASGGRLLMDGKAPDGRTQWAVVLDPNGAAFGLIPVVTPEQMPPPAGGSPDAPVGRIFWLDLTVSDASATRDFYRQVVGWSVQDVEMTEGDARYADYNMVGEAGKPAAGVCHARGPNADLPPVWMIYLPVGNLGESIARAEEEGGTVLTSMRSEDGKVVYAAIQDPVGAAFALVQG